MVNKVTIHPLALLNVSDQNYRSKVGEKGGSGKSQGLLLGLIKEDICSIAIAIEIVEGTEFDDVYKYLQLLGQIYPHLKVVGAYSVSQEEKETAEEVRLFRQWTARIDGGDSTLAGHTESLVFVRFENKSFASKAFDIMSLEEIPDVEISAFAMENIALNEMSQASEPLSGDASKDPMEETKAGIQNGLQQVSAGVGEMIRFLKSVENGTVKVYEGHSSANYALVKKISQLVRKIKTMSQYAGEGADKKMVSLAIISQSLLLENAKKSSDLSNLSYVL